MRKTGFLIFLILLTAAGCRQQATTQNADFNIALVVEPEPLVVGDAMLVITVTDSSSAPVNDAKIAVRGDMNHAGMTSVFGEIESGSNGQYRVPFEWAMAGDWIVEVTVTLANGEKVVKSFDMKVASSAPEMTTEAES